MADYNDVYRSNRAQIVEERPVQLAQAGWGKSQRLAELRAEWKRVTDKLDAVEARLKAIQQRNEALLRAYSSGGFKPPSPAVRMEADALVKEEQQLEQEREQLVRRADELIRHMDLLERGR